MCVCEGGSGRLHAWRSMWRLWAHNLKVGGSCSRQLSQHTDAARERIVIDGVSGEPIRSNGRSKVPLLSVGLAGFSFVLGVQALRLRMDRDNILKEAKDRDDDAQRRVEIADSKMTAMLARMDALRSSICAGELASSSLCTELGVLLDTVVSEPMDAANDSVSTLAAADVSIAASREGKRALV